jgi:DNA (cytosine-5)-methyltransferase 1
LFYEVVRYLDELQPEWVVLENVAALLHSNDSRDIAAVIQELAQRGYLGCFRVLDAAHFGSPAKRRRVFMVGRLGGPAPLELLSDAAPVDAIPASFSKERLTQGALAWPGNTLQASNAACRISLGSELLVAEADGWHSMVERERTSARDGIPLGLDERDWAQVYATGNAVSVQCAKFIAQKIIAEMKRP